MRTFFGFGIGDRSSECELSLGSVSATITTESVSVTSPAGVAESFTEAESATGPSESDDRSFKRKMVRK